MGSNPTLSALKKNSNRIDGSNCIDESIKWSQWLFYAFLLVKRLDLKRVSKYLGIVTKRGGDRDKDRDNGRDKTDEGHFGFFTGSNSGQTEVKPSEPTSPTKGEVTGDRTGY
ncbi:hypothetical protein V5G20_00990 [Brevibacillus borstelensis]|uniref:hypothetical protein n=1 Tax=Brevibacillus borstelensis TaxID=45462 RepID=UPI0030D2F83D